jgi:hypothetical protein
MAKHTQKMEKQVKALYPHVNNRQSVSKPENAKSLNDMGGSRLESPSGKDPVIATENAPGAPPAHRGIRERRLSRSADI